MFIWALNDQNRRTQTAYNDKYKWYIKGIELFDMLESSENEYAIFGFLRLSDSFFNTDINSVSGKLNPIVFGK